ncbi:MAG: DEAD/DEAH box helicase [Desulfobacterales bacterium]
MNDEPQGPSEEFEVPSEPPRASKPEFLTSTRFDSFKLPPEILRGLADAGFEHCTPIQAESLPVLLAGRDVAGQAHTGTGKTAAFLVTVLTGLLERGERPPMPQALILAPTRELSRQIVEEARLLGRYTGLTLLEVVGGIDYKEQAEELRKGVDIVIGTPGRIIDYYKQGIFKTREIRYLVIDEADRLLDLGFEKDMRFLLRKLPSYEKRQSMLFSATLSHRVLELTYEFMNLPEFISVVPDKVTVAGIDQSLFHVGSDRKFSLLLGILQREVFSRMLIFVNTKIEAERLARRLQRNGHPAEGITGDLPQRKRFRLMERFKSGEVRILIATDVASRGIHVEDVSHVINYDVPQDPENYVHRIGRTARAGRTGKAITLACEEYVYHLEPLEAFLGFRIPVVWPEDDWFLEDRSRPEDLRRPRRADRREGRREAERPGRRGGRPRGRGEAAPAEAPAEGRKPKAKRVPGAFFGFGPQPAEEEPEAAETVEPASDAAAPPSAEESAPAGEAAERPKKRRRRRRKKRSTPAAEGAEGSAAAQPAEPPEAEADGEPTPGTEEPSGFLP